MAADAEALGLEIAGYHEVFNEREPERARVLGDLTAWVDARLS